MAVKNIVDYEVHQVVPPKNRCNETLKGHRTEVQLIFQHTAGARDGVSADRSGVMNSDIAQLAGCLVRCPTTRGS
eukprot:1940542-Pyramimonas_sp.AAC.1